MLDWPCRAPRKSSMVLTKAMGRAANKTAEINRQLLKVRTDFERLAARAAQNGDHQLEHMCQAIVRRIDRLLPRRLRSGSTRPKSRRLGTLSLSQRVRGRGRESVR